MSVALLVSACTRGQSPTMPPSPDLESNPKVVDGLVTIVRSFRASK